MSFAYKSKKEFLRAEYSKSDNIFSCFIIHPGSPTFDISISNLSLSDIVIIGLDLSTQFFVEISDRS